MSEVKHRSAASSSEATPASAETWARRLQRGRADAVREVRNRVSKILRYRGFSMTDDERDDLEQEIMTEIWQAVNRSHFDPSGGFWGFVEVVSARRCIDWLRSRQEEVALPDGGSVTEERWPLRLSLERERADLASEVLSKLTKGCRELITLRLRDELTYREIAQATGKTEGALRVQLYRCIERARQLVEERLDQRVTNRPDRVT